MIEWTDLDYAQAAIDMLPGSVEEIAEFLCRQGIRPQWKEGRCPVDQWVDKWVDSSFGVYTSHINVSVAHKGLVRLPKPVGDYVSYVDGGAF